MTGESELIQEISEVLDHKIEGEEYDGFRIRTNKQTIYVVIDNCQRCCEDWGYISTPTADEVSELIGTKLLSIDIVNQSLNKTEFVSCPAYEDDFMFVHFNTDRGVFELAVYNHHNGYYGHRAKLISQQLKKDKSL